MPPSSPLLPTLARRLSFGSTTLPAAGSLLLPSSTSTSTSSSSSSSPSCSSRRSLSTSAPLAARRPDEWSYPSDMGDNKPRRPFLNPDVSDWIPNEVAIRAGLKPYRQPSASLDVYALPPTLERKFGILTHTITFTAYEQESLKPYGAMARHAALALLIPVAGPRVLKPTLRRWASNSSPFVHSASKQIFERRTWQTEVDVYDADDKAVEVMVKVLLASGRGEHVKLNVQKYSTGEFLLDSTSPTTAPLTHTTKRMAALVQEMADRFVKDEYARLAATKDKKGVVDPEAVRIAKIEAEERASKGLPPLESDEVVVPQNLTSTGEGDLPAFAGKTQWKKYLEKEINSPQAQARKKLDGLAPSKTLQIFLSNPAQAILTSTSSPSDANANAVDPSSPSTTTTSLTTTLTPEHIPELIRPHLHIRSTFLVSSQPLLKPPTLPTPPESFTPPIHPRVPHQSPNRTSYVPSEDVALAYSREVSAKYVALPGEGTYYLVEFGTVEEARRVREELDDRVLGDGTVLDVWFAKEESKKGTTTAAGGEGEGEEAAMAWIEARGVGTEGWKRVEVEKLEEEREVERKRMSGIREHTGPAWATLGTALDGIKEEEVRELEAAKESAKEKVEDDVKETIAESTSSTITEKVEETKGSIVDTAEEVKASVESKIEDHVQPTIVEKVEQQVKDALPTASTLVEKVAETKETVLETAQNVKKSVASSKIEEVTPSSSSAAAIEEKVESIKETIVDALPTATPTAAEVSEKVEQAKEVVGEKVQAVKESAVNVKEKIEEEVKVKVKPAASSFVEKVAEKMEEAKEVVSEKVEEVKEKVEEVVGGVKEKVVEEKKVKEVEKKKKGDDETDGSSKP